MKLVLVSFQQLLYVAEMQNSAPFLHSNIPAITPSNLCTMFQGMWQRRHQTHTALGCTTHIHYQWKQFFVGRFFWHSHMHSVSSNISNFHAMRVYRGEDTQLHTFLILALEGGDWSNSRFGRFICGKELLQLEAEGSSEVVWGDWRREKSLAFVRISTQDRPVCRLLCLSFLHIGQNVSAQRIS